ncbi:MAG TPA: signal peptide peptidase SppA, partial [Chthoniobacterales bacterium]
DACNGPFLSSPMKAFFGSFFGTIFALLILLAGVLGFLFLCAGALQKVAQKAPSVQPNSWLVLDLSVPITDAPARFDPAQLVTGLQNGNADQRVTLRDVLLSINRAAADRQIAGIFLTGTVLPIDYASGYGALREVRQALQRFQQSKKPVYAFLNDPTTRAYYVASVADKIFMDPSGTLAMSGLASQRLYFSGLLKKFGIGVQASRVGNYKSFVEPYLSDRMSPEDREQTEKLLRDLWSEITSAIEQSRSLPAGAVQQAVSENALIDADAALQHKLVTELTSLSAVVDQLRAQYGDARKDDTFRQIPLSDYLSTLLPSNHPGDDVPKIGIVYAEGEIVDGEGDRNDVGGDRYARAVRQFRLDPSVKGIVLRVNSPGGSVSASSVIRHELERAAAAKPVVISFGSVAASGGYYISSVNSHIFAEPNTITGSIGVFGLFLNFQKLANDNGVTFDTVQTSPYASILSPLRPKTDAELAMIQGMIDKDYREFLQIVASARRLSIDQVNELAQGRVWSGTDAIRLHLVDELGGLGDAVAYAGRQTQLGDRPILKEFPERQNLNDKIRELINGNDHLPVSRLDPVNQELQRLQQELVTLRRLNDPRGIYALLPFGWRVD